MSLLNQLKLKMKKASQFDIESNVFEIPECAALSTTDKISIKVADNIQMIRTIMNCLENQFANFNIRFLIRDERSNKQTIMFADLISGYGFEVKNTSGIRMMDIKTLNNMVSSIGKISHPLGATIYEVNNGKILADNIETNIQRFQVHRLSLNQPIIKGKRRMDGTELARVYPKIALNGRTLILKYKTIQLGMQMRAAILGTSLMLILHEVYPDIRNGTGEIEIT
ncbi:hypothetical protein DINM_000298 [Dirofilaria immitis]|nr:hypothetical protein [Dirofilaria immitis]